MRVHQRGSREKGSEGEDLATEGPSERADAESLEVDERESVAALRRDEQKSAKRAVAPTGEMSRGEGKEGVRKRRQSTSGAGSLR